MKINRFRLHDRPPSELRPIDAAGTRAKLKALVADYAAETRMRTPARRLPTRTAPRVIVSLTSHARRIDTAWLAVESLLRQSVTPTRLILVLASEEFRDRGLPASLEARIARGLEIRWVSRDIGSYKKLIPLESDASSSTIVTADDDTMYPRWWLQTLLRGHQAFPNTILGLRASAIMTPSEGSVPLYSQWPGAHRATPSRRVVLKGNGGILYPPNCLPAPAFDADLALSLCPTADDIWFKAMALAANVEVRRLLDGYLDFPTVRRAQNSSLFNANVRHGGNDIQFHQVMDRFDLWPKLTDPPG